MSIKLPKKFEFTWNGAPGYTYSNEQYSYYDCGHQYTYYISHKEFQEYVELGFWVITKNLDEPELVFPFTFNSITGTIPCRAEKYLNGKIGISWGENYTSRYTEDEIRQQIKSGEWIVTSVGEQPMTDTERFVSTLKSEPSEDAIKFYEGVTPLKIQVDSNDIKEATHNMNLLAQAAENVNIALESMKALLREIGQGEMTTACTGSFPIINFEV